MLLIGPSAAIGEALVPRLLRQSDEVRVVEEDAGLAATWAALGAHVARGSRSDADLVERAAQNVRTIVVMPRPGDDAVELLSAVVDGATHASPSMRIVVCASHVDASVASVVKDSGLDHVVLRTGAKLGGFLPLTVERVPATALAEAIDAADDLPGSPKLDLDLTVRGSWGALHLSAP
ncbi:hypothetical protein BH24ACT26_BH24ACT26_08020 [soil metagenome]